MVDILSFYTKIKHRNIEIINFISLQVRELTNSADDQIIISLTVSGIVTYISLECFLQEDFEMSKSG